MSENRVWEAIDDGMMMQQLYVEMDPSRRYGRFKDVLGKGAVKTVYKAFDEFLGMEVAWNQVRLNNVLRSPDELQRLYSEVHLLNNLHHHSIMTFRSSWINVHKRTFNFITEMFTSGTLREYRKKYKRVNIRAIKAWARQILEGLDYLHSHDPPIIHRDLKCDNIFVNGHLGQVKIGDLGLAAILRGSHHAHSVIGTPEFMAPELYEEDYDELVDIYSFGMCILEMLTMEYPYSECINPAQIYKKVTSGKLPDAFYRVCTENVEARRFVGRCLKKASNRPSAKELLMDPFLSFEELPVSKTPREKAGLFRELSLPSRLPATTTHMTIKGTMNPEDDTIFLKVQIYDKVAIGSKGRARNIYFPYDITSDTSLDVATEMVKELEISDWEPIEIANMIEEEISNLVPSRQDSTSSKNQWQHSFTFSENNNDISPSPPFYSSSSCSSSQASLPRPDSSHEKQHSCRADEANNYVRVSASSCSNLNHGTENEAEFLSNIQKQLNSFSGSKKCTRFGHGRSSMAKNCRPTMDCNLTSNDKMMRTFSEADIRSQLLHQRLVSEINKQRLFKTVGAVEHILCHEPPGVNRSN